MIEVRVVVNFIDYFDLFCKVFRILFPEKASISRFAIPVASSFELVRHVGIILFARSLFYKLVRIGAFASQGEITSSMGIGRLYILVASFVSGKS